jgi:hypothetical protein
MTPFCSRIFPLRVLRALVAEAFSLDAIGIPVFTDCGCRMNFGEKIMWRRERGAKVWGEILAGGGVTPCARPFFPQKNTCFSFFKSFVRICGEGRLIMSINQ